MTSWRIVCDVGGTNIRYARSDASRRLSHLVVAPSESCVSLEETLLAFAHGFDDHDDLAGIAVAAAGPLEDGAVQLTNLSLSISANAIRRTFDGRSARVLNDLEAVAWSLPYLSDADLSSICVAARALSGPRLVVNVGTGFGAAVLVSTPGGWHSIPCEPGHMNWHPGSDALQENFSQRLRSRTPSRAARFEIGASLTSVGAAITSMLCLIEPQTCLLICPPRTRRACSSQTTAQFSDRFVVTSCWRAVRGAAFIFAEALHRLGASRRIRQPSALLLSKKDLWRPE